MNSWGMFWSNQINMKTWEEICNHVCLSLSPIVLYNILLHIHTHTFTFFNTNYTERQKKHHFFRATLTKTYPIKINTVEPRYKEVGYNKTLL